MSMPLTISEAFDPVANTKLPPASAMKVGDVDRAGSAKAATSARVMSAIAS